MDGSPSAPDSERLELTEGSSRPTDTERELNVLRARAYGPRADIYADPTALARLIDLEAAAALTRTTQRSLGAVATAADASSTASPGALNPAAADPGSAAGGGIEELTSPPKRRAQFSWRGARRARNGTWWAVAGVAVIASIGAAAVVWLGGPRPDASLQRTAADANSTAMAVLGGNGWRPVASTLRQFEPYHGVVVWSVETAIGDICIAAWDSTGSRFDFRCSPPATEHSVHLRNDPNATDGFGDWLPEGSILSFHLRDNTVDVFIRSAAN